MKLLCREHCYESVYLRTKEKESTGGVLSTTLGFYLHSTESKLYEELGCSGSVAEQKYIKILWIYLGIIVKSLLNVLSEVELL